MRRVAWKEIAALVFGLQSIAIAGCGDSFDPASLVAGLRVLGVKAEPAEAAPGTEVTLRALVVDTRGREVRLDWAACLLGPTPVDPRCVTEDAASYLAPAGSGETATVTMPPLRQQDLARADFTGGVYLPVRLRARTTSGDPAEVTAIYGMRWSLGLPVPPNRNPTIASVSVVRDGQPIALDEATPLEVPAGSDVTLRAAFAPGSAEEYLALRGDPRTTPPETTKEVPSVSWFVTAGRIEPDVTGEERPDTTLALGGDRAPAAGTIIDVWAVAREERGGLDWAHRRLRVK